MIYSSARSTGQRKPSGSVSTRSTLPTMCGLSQQVDVEGDCLARDDGLDGPLIQADRRAQEGAPVALCELLGQMIKPALILFGNREAHCDRCHWIRVYVFSGDAPTSGGTPSPLPSPGEEGICAPIGR